MEAWCLSCRRSIRWSSENLLLWLTQTEITPYPLLANGCLTPSRYFLFLESTKDIKQGLYLTSVYFKWKLWKSLLFCLYPVLFTTYYPHRINKALFILYINRYLQLYVMVKKKNKVILHHFCTLKEFYRLLFPTVLKFLEKFLSRRCRGLKTQWKREWWMAVSSEDVKATWIKETEKELEK